MSFIFTCMQISQACKPIVVAIGLWESVKALARGYEYMMGLVLFTPVAVLAWFPFVSEFQSRLLFNQAFSRGLQISRILAGGKRGWFDLIWFDDDVLWFFCIIRREGMYMIVYIMLSLVLNIHKLKMINSPSTKRLIKTNQSTALNLTLKTHF